MNSENINKMRKYLNLLRRHVKTDILQVVIG